MTDKIIPILETTLTWIKCEDKFPEKYGRVLTITIEKNVGPMIRTLIFDPDRNTFCDFNLTFELLPSEIKYWSIFPIKEINKIELNSLNK